MGLWGGMRFPERNRFLDPALGVSSFPDADAVLGAAVDVLLIGHAVRRQRLLQRGALLPIVERHQHHIGPRVPEIRGRVISIYAVGDVIIVIAAAVAVGAVKQWLMENDYPIRVIFDVFLDKDLAIYREILDNV